MKFAEKLFGLDNSLTPAAIKMLIDGKKTRTASLKTKVPVHLSYFTVWIDDDGVPNFFADIYDRDTLVSRLLLSDGHTANESWALVPVVFLACPAQANPLTPS